MKSEHKTMATTLAIILLAVTLVVAIRTTLSQDSFRIPKKDVPALQRTRKVLADSESDNFVWWEIFDLRRNSYTTQKTLALILLIPVGVLITAACRTLIGLRTIGTFSPTLLAISQVKADWRVGAIVFILTFGVGSLVRMLLLKQNLTAVARRGIVAVFVVLFLAASITLSEHFRPETTTRHILLPVVVTTTMIESFFVILEKESKILAIRVLLNTLFVTFLCFVIFSETEIGSIFLKYPGLELLVATVLFLIGRYSGRTVIDVFVSSRTESLEQNT